MSWLHGCARVMVEGVQERMRQEDKWGEQNYPDAPPDLNPGASATAQLGIISATAAKRACDDAHREGRGTYAHILIEEVAEAIEDIRDEDKLRAELVQVLAVTCAWIELIDRRRRQAGEARLRRAVEDGEFTHLALHTAVKADGIGEHEYGPIWLRD